jgi:LytS/YehU family sensor histidine kinase
VHNEKIFEEMTFVVWINFTIFTLIYVSVTTFFSMMREWFVLQKILDKVHKIEKEKLEAELKVLKSQINPHFLFNMLNNIYSLSLEKSDKSPKMILMLSELMSYILYDCQEERVPIKMEVDFLQNLIDLEQISVGDDVDIKFIYDESLIEHSVTPLLFIPFVENAFKHCSKNGKDTSFVSINLNLENDQICLVVENSVDGIEEAIKDNYHGVGITNVKKRLQHIYPQTHSLKIEETKSSYKVELYLKLVEANV